MVVVKIELWPGGDQSKARTLGMAMITNDGSGDVATGSYDVELSHSGRYFGRPGCWRRGEVKNHDRQLSPYHLVLSALRAALGWKG